MGFHLTVMVFQVVQECRLGGGLLQAAQASDSAESQLRRRHEELRRLPRDGLETGAERLRQRVQDVRGLLSLQLQSIQF